MLFLLLQTDLVPDDTTVYAEVYDTTQRKPDDVNTLPLSDKKISVHGHTKYVDQTGVPAITGRVDTVRGFMQLDPKFPLVIH